MLKIVKRMYGGRISFNDPVLKPVFWALDGADGLVRLLTGRTGLPPFSIRAHTNGVQGEFGGAKFINSGKMVLDRLQKLGVDLADKDILDVGSSCGRLAFAAREKIGNGTYHGIDIDKVTIEWAKRHFANEKGKFNFNLIDVYSDVYNSSSATDASTYKFPFPESKFDLVFAYSLFTHLLEDELKNYIYNSYRVLRENGKFVFSCFSVNGDLSGTFLERSVKSGNTYIYSPDSPRKANAYEKEYIEDILRSAGFRTIVFDQGIWRTPNKLGGVDQDFYYCEK